MAGPSLLSYDNVCKVMIIGGDGVGKSSLIEMFVNGESLQKERIGVTVDQKFVELDESRIKVEIWDVVGNDTLGDIFIIHFLRLCNGIILTYDLTSKDSLVKAASQMDLVRKAINKHRLDTSIPIILVGTKSDLTEKREVHPTDISSIITAPLVFCFETTIHDLLSIEYAIISLITQIFSWRFRLSIAYHNRYC